MISLSQIESDLVTAMKAKDQIAVDTLRGLKTRIQNQKTAIGRPKRSEGSLTEGNKMELSENEILALVKSEVKRRKEAAQTYAQGARQELADKELLEAAILEKYLPAQMPEHELSALVEKIIAENSFAAKDFGTAMGELKRRVGNQADGALLARLLKERLK